MYHRGEKLYAGFSSGGRLVSKPVHPPPPPFFSLKVTSDHSQDLSKNKFLLIDFLEVICWNTLKQSCANTSHMTFLNLTSTILNVI